MATLDSFREATGEPIQLDLANGYIADIRLNAGDINGRTITVELTDNGTPITSTDGITCALAYNTTPGSGLGDRVSMPAVFGTPTATYRVAVPRKALQRAGVVFATQSDIDAQYDSVIAPALSDAETIPPLTQSDIDWALDIINR